MEGFGQGPHLQGLDSGLDAMELILGLPTTTIVIAAAGVGLEMRSTENQEETTGPTIFTIADIVGNEQLDIIGADVRCWVRHEGLEVVLHCG